MYLALRDIRFARGRFALVVGVVALIMLLTGFLAGLAGGLAKQNVSAVLETDADRVVFGMPAGERPAFGDSRLTAPQLDAWAARPGVEEAVPIGIGRGALGLPGQQERLVPVALFGAPAGWRGTVPAEGEGIALAEATAQRLGVGPGDEVELAGSPFRVAAVTPELMYAHQEAAWLPDGDYREAMASMRQQAPEATVLLVSGSGVDWAAADAEAGTVSQPLLPALLAIESFRSEIGSLGLMIGMLFLIGALVVGVFFLVWSLQRQRDLAVLKALGASDRMLRADAFGQAVLVLTAGIGLGVAATLGLGSAVANALPFAIEWFTILVPAVAMLLAGAAGSLVSLVQVTRADPLVALGAAAA